MDEIIHELKTWPEHFDPILKGYKLFEVRKNDRNFQVGDSVRLCEYDPKLQRYTGRTIKKQITYLLQGEFGVPPDICVLSLAPAGYAYPELLAQGEGIKCA